VAILAEGLTMAEQPRKPVSVSKRFSLGIIGLTSLIVGFYIGYELIFWVSNSLPSLTDGRPYELFDAIFILIFLFLIACWICLVVVFIIFAYPFLKSAITMAPLDIDLVKSSGAYITVAIILLAFMWISPRYTAWDPHLSEKIKKDNFDFAITGIKAADHIEYGCDDFKNNINGWKFLILDYSIYNKGENPIFILPELLVDENGIGYSNFDKDCPTKNYNFDYERSVPENSYRSGSIVYKIPINAIPAKVSMSISGTNPPISISLHHRRSLFT